MDGVGFCRRAALGLETVAVKTYEEAMANIKEALTLYLEVAKERNQEIVEDNTHIAEMAITL